METEYTETTDLKDFSLWEKLGRKRVLTSFDLEITSRCFNNCKHCYINVPAGDREAKIMELSLEEIEKIADEAVELGALWCLITGGEPLLRKDFPEIYTMLKKKGLLVSVFTSATLITEQHIELFKKYPPREIEVTVYGVTEKTYEKISRVPGSFNKFMRGMDLLLKSGLKVRLKTMALRSNLDEFEEIAEFCRKKTGDYYRFDPHLHLRYDRNPVRNEEIKSERLTAAEIVELEKSDPERSADMEDHCDQFIFDPGVHYNCNHLFHCGAGRRGFVVSPEGILRLCASLWHPDMIYNLRKGTVKDAWENFIPRVLDTRSDNPEYHSKCHSCNIINLCLWCPAHAYLETGVPDQWVDSFCRTAHARAEALKMDEG